jgi:DNA repair protein RAD50
LPPGGAKAGQSFVHDPKSIGQATVKANIKLRFTNRAGNSMVMVRSMEVSQKKAAMTFKALDGVLRTTNPDTGERISMSHKCAEMDRQLPLLLGVSRPILEHVVFCHQEDSSWPLQQSSDVKKKFDDIFDSTRYAKALKHILEIKKDYVSKAKDLKAEVALLAGHQHAAKGFRQELDEQQEELEEFEEELAKIQEAIKSAEQQKADAAEILDQVEEFNKDIDDAQASLDTEMTVMKKQKSMLGTEDLTVKHTQRELKDMLSDFDDDMRSQVEKQDDLAKSFKKIKHEIESCYNDESDLKGKKGKYVAEREQHESRMKQRFAKMEELAEAYGIELAVTQTQNASMMTGTQGTSASDTVVTGGSQDSVISISDEDMQAFMGAVARKQTELSEKLKHHKSQAQSAEDILTVSLSDLLAKQKSIDNGKPKLCPSHFVQIQAYLMLSN